MLYESFFFLCELDWLHYGFAFSLQQSIQQILLSESCFLEKKSLSCMNANYCRCMLYLLIFTVRRITLTHVFLWLVGSHRLVPPSLHSVLLNHLIVITQWKPNQNTNLAITWQAQLEPKGKSNLGFEFSIFYFLAVTIFDSFFTLLFFMDCEMFAVSN